jgi:hypothetical protein
MIIIKLKSYYHKPQSHIKQDTLLNLQFQHRVHQTTTNETIEINTPSILQHLIKLTGKEENSTNKSA